MLFPMLTLNSSTIWEALGLKSNLQQKPSEFRYLYLYVHSHVIHSSYEGGNKPNAYPQMKGKQNTVNPYSRLWLGQTKEWHLIDVTTGTDLKNFMFSEKSQTQRTSDVWVPLDSTHGVDKFINTESRTGVEDRQKWKLLFNRYRVLIGEDITVLGI